MTTSQLIGVSAVAIDGRAMLIEGAPGSGKSSLALALIDRGAALIGDDGVSLRCQGEEIIVTPPPNITGMLEIHGVGIVNFPTSSGPLALVLTLGDQAPRLPQSLSTRDICGQAIPGLPFCSGGNNAALRAEWALRVHGLTF